MKKYRYNPKEFEEKVLKPASSAVKKVFRNAGELMKDVGRKYDTGKYKTSFAFRKISQLQKMALKKNIESSKKVGREINRKYGKKASGYWAKLGPGLTTGAADDDPSGIATYSQTGAKYGFKLLWMSIVTFPLMSIVQEMCARIGIVTGKGLASNIRQHYKPFIIYACTFLLLIANIFNISVDLGMMAKSTQLLFPHMNFILLLVFFTVLSLGLQIFIAYPRYAKYLKYLALVLFSYVLSVLMIKAIDWGAILHSIIIPSITFSKDQIILICAILGTTISPYLFFWQTSQEVEEMKNSKGESFVKVRQAGAINREDLKGELKKMRIDVWSGMFLSNLVMFAIIVATAATLFSHGITEISSVQDAAIALRPLAGEQTYLLFTIGVIGAGLLAVPILAGSVSYALSESLKIKGGLNYKLKEAPIFYGVIIFSMVIGFAINFLGIDIIKALIYSAVVNGIIAPFILFFIVKISSNKKIMGKNMNGNVVKIFGWILVGVMTIAGIATIIALVT